MFIRTVPNSWQWGRSTLKYEHLSWQHFPFYYGVLPVIATLMIWLIIRWQSYSTLILFYGINDTTI